jgi:hypothetical protein
MLGPTRGDFAGFCIKSSHGMFIGDGAVGIGLLRLAVGVFEMLLKKLLSRFASSPSIFCTSALVAVADGQYACRPISPLSFLLIRIGLQ